MLVGEAPGEQETFDGLPFVGRSGQELTRMLVDAGINREDCFITNVVHQRPPNNEIEEFYEINTEKNRKPGLVMQIGIEQLKKDIAEIKPELIITFGDTAHWALTGNKGIMKWRGSQLHYSGAKLVPTLHPANVLRAWENRFPAVEDLKRAREWHEGKRNRPEYNFIVHPPFEDVLYVLQTMLSIADRHSDVIYTADIETFAGHIDCLGFGISSTRAICIPFMRDGDSQGYWTYDEELEIVLLIQKLFHHKHIRWVFQNGLYDLQYFIRHWNFCPEVWMDTMLAQHVCFLGMPKSLDFLSSIYCDYHTYWKDDGKNRIRGIEQEKHWIYNCTDCVVTFEVAENLWKTIKNFKHEPQLAEQMRTFKSILTMMLRGVRCDLVYKEKLIDEMEKAVKELNDWCSIATRRPKFKPSPKQLKEIFYEELKCDIVKDRKTKKPTTNFEALEKFRLWYPLLVPLINRIQALRSAKTYKGNYAYMRLDIDNRIRCSYNVGGTESLRLSSSENAFGSGRNLQNMARKHKDPDDPKSWLPNVKLLFTPDPGYVIIDADLERADAQVVAAEAQDVELRDMFRKGVDIHAENAKVIFGLQQVSEDSKERQLCKAGVHAVNYYCKPRTLAITLGITIREAENFIRRWFAAHPGIPEWHKRTEYLLQTTRRISNRFGFTRRYFERVEDLLPEALAWVPQSTVGLVTNRGINAIDEQLPWVEILLQNHDSTVFQIPKEKFTFANLSLIRSLLEVPVPYDDPLTIPVNFKASETSWGECRNFILRDEKIIFPE